MTRETVWEGTEAARDRLEGKQLPEIRKSLPPPPTPAKDVRESPKMESTPEQPITEGATARELCTALPHETHAEDKSTFVAEQPPSPISQQIPLAPVEDKPINELPQTQKSSTEANTPQPSKVDENTKPDDTLDKTGLANVDSPESLAPEPITPETLASEPLSELRAESKPESKNVPKVDSIVKRLSLKLDAERGMEPKHKPSTSPTKEASPSTPNPLQSHALSTKRASSSSVLSPSQSSASPTKRASPSVLNPPQPPASPTKRASPSVLNSPQSPASPTKRASSSVLNSPQSPASPTKKDTPPARTSTQSSIAARRAMFEKR
jgi:hypothetical protein